ncbi:hypothetical protein CRG98_017608 [Punica granatum]|uniref:Uncharacterized protein n=1 Tax=Punica granatum TaxID=22663 RepID=A0A2I0K0B2_PUNGR|nr:hypothetical protein CRG98_017608 [Punica granatum]
MQEEKSRGSGRGSRKTRFESYGWVTRANPVKNKRMKRRLSTVEWLSDRDHLFTGESEGCEEPLERDGTTRQSRGKKWQVVGVRCARLGALGTQLHFRPERDVGDLKWKI